MFYILRAMPSLDQMNKNKMKMKNLGTTLTNQNYIQEEIKSRLD
jgi:hypothetical protein